MKTKTCVMCHTQMDVAYRIQIKKGKEWIFVGIHSSTVLQKGEFYRYGGSWKGYRH